MRDAVTPGIPALLRSAAEILAARPRLPLLDAIALSITRDGLSREQWDVACEAQHVVLGDLGTTHVKPEQLTALADRIEVAP